MVDGERLLAFKVLICAAGAATRHLHLRNSVILEQSDWECWLTSESEVANLMRPAADERVELREVAPAVGNLHNDWPKLIAPIGEAL